MQSCKQCSVCPTTRRCMQCNHPHIPATHVSGSGSGPGWTPQTILNRQCVKCLAKIGVPHQAMPTVEFACPYCNTSVASLISGSGQEEQGELKRKSVETSPYFDSSHTTRAVAQTTRGNGQDHGILEFLTSVKNGNTWNMSLLSNNRYSTYSTLEERYLLPEEVKSRPSLAPQGFQLRPNLVARSDLVRAYREWAAETGRGSSVIRMKDIMAESDKYLPRAFTLVKPGDKAVQKHLIVLRWDHEAFH